MLTKLRSDQPSISFLNRSHLTSRTSSEMKRLFVPRQAWTKSCRTKESAPVNLAVMDLRLLVHQMQTDAFAWRILKFISSADSVDLTFLQYRPYPTSITAKGTQDSAAGVCCDPTNISSECDEHILNGPRHGKQACSEYCTRSALRTFFLRCRSAWYTRLKHFRLK